ncbi:hypothetical protein, partial [Enterobacter hormaechei]|uniref:hypothetical protein n=1 Tax=Enterobacter hormaechei TaxID=158836 RepID=UPI0023E38A4B
FGRKYLINGAAAPLFRLQKITVFNSPSLTGAGSYCLKTEQEFICLPPKQQIKHQPYPKKAA